MILLAGNIYEVCIFNFLCLFAITSLICYEIRKVEQPIFDVTGCL